MDSIEKIVAEMRECSIGNRHDAAMIDDWADRLASLRQVPDGEADELIRLLGFDPERFRTEAGFINHSKLRAAIKNPADYEGLMLHTTPGQWVPIKPEGAPYWGIHTATGETVAGTSSGLCEGDARLICELRNASLVATPAQAGSHPESGDREALNYLMQQFDAEFHSCERCGMEEPTKDCDSAIYLREYLAKHPAQAGAELPEHIDPSSRRLPSPRGVNQ